MAPCTTRTAQGIWTLIGDWEAPDATLFDTLMEAARAVRARAYAPYSNFQVGAAALVEGRIYPGCNVENASYGGTMCAERSAIFNAVAAGGRKLEIMAITTDARNEVPIASRSPCGFCRQVMAEFANEETLVLLDAGEEDNALYKGEVIRFADLLPWQFRLS